MSRGHLTYGKFLLKCTKDLCIPKIFCNFAAIFEVKPFYNKQKMIGTSTEILLWLSNDYRYAPLFCMSRQKLVGLRRRLYDNRLTLDGRDRLLQNLCDRIKKLTNPVSTTDVSTMPSVPDERKWYPKTILLPVPEVRCVRKGMIIPAVIHDKKGRAFTETTFLRMIADEWQMKDLHIDKVLGMMKAGGLPDKKIVREALRRKEWNMFVDRYELPSVWEVVQFASPK